MPTPEQENELRKAVGLAPLSPAVDYAVPSKPRISEDVALEELFKDAGVDTQSVQQQVMAEQNKEKQDRYMALQKEIEGFESARMAGKVAEETLGAVAGIGLGFRDIARNTYNGLVTLADSAENYAAQHGIGAGDLITNATKWEDSYGTEVGKGVGTTGNIARAVTNFAGPLLATVSSGGGFLAGMGVNAAYNFLAIDPKQARLTDHLKGTGLSEVPVAAEVIDYLSSKPDDSELTARFKNLVEGAGIDAAVGGILWGASKAYTGIKSLRAPKTMEDAAKEVATAKAPAPVPVPVTPAEQAALDQSDEVISAVAPSKQPQPKPVTEDPAQLELFDKEWAKLELDQPPVYTKPEGEVRLRLTDDQLLDRFYVMSKQIDQAVLRTPMTDAELKEASRLMRSDSAVVDRLATWTPDKGVPSDKETLVLKYIMHQGDSSMRDAITNVVTNINDDVTLLKFSREFENYARLLEIRQGTASAKGATLRAEKVIGQLAQTGDKEALAMLGAQGRAKLVEGLLEKYGGRANIQKIAQSASFIEELAKVSKTPDTDFAMRMGDVVQKSAWMQIDQAVTKVALNGLLSSPGTSLKAVITNIATTGKTIIDNYVAVGVGKVVNSEGAKTLAEANAHLKGVISGLYEGIAPAVETTKTGTATRFTRLDLTDAAQVVNQDDAMFKASGAWASKVGLVSETLSANRLPVRILMGVDTYWQMVNYRGVVNAEAIRAGVSQGLKGKELTAFVEAFNAKPPPAVDYAATQIAQANTMAKQLTGFAESIDNVIEQGSSYIPFARVVLPFFKTNMNIVEYTAKNSPFAPLLSQDFRTAIATGGRSRDEALAKVISGSAILGGLVALANGGMINGRNTQNPEIEQALKDNKSIAPETSIKIGDTWYSVKGLEPISTFVNMAAGLNKIAGYVSEDEYQQTATAVAIMAAEVATPEQLTDSLSGLLNVMAGKQGAKEYLATIPSRFTPMGSALTDVRQTVDPTIRVTKFKDFLDTVFARFENQVPYLSKNLPAQRNVWGEKLVLPDGIGPDAISPIATTSDEGMALKGALERMDDFYELNKDKAFGLYKFDLSMPPKQIKNPMANVQYQFTPQEYSAYVVLSGGINPSNGKPIWNDGRTLKQVVTDVVKKYDGFNKRPQDYDPTTYAAMVGELSKAFSNYRKVADKLILQFGDVQAKMKAQADQYRAFEELNNER